MIKIEKLDDKHFVIKLYHFSVLQRRYILARPPERLGVNGTVSFLEKHDIPEFYIQSMIYALSNFNRKYAYFSSVTKDLSYLL